MSLVAMFPCRARSGRVIKTTIICLVTVCVILSVEYTFRRDETPRNKMDLSGIVRETVTLSAEHVQKLRNWTLEREKARSVWKALRLEKPTCLAELNPFNPEVMLHYKKVQMVDCTVDLPDWVYASNGQFHISRDARQRHGNITCKYIPLYRVSDYETKEGTAIEPMEDGANLTSDFFKVECKSDKGVNYHNIHSGVARHENIFKRLESYKQEKLKESQRAPQDTDHESDGLPRESESLNLNVFMFGFDSTSRMSWLRNLPNTRQYFVHELGGVEMEGYNIVGDGTPAALLPILTGHTEEELPEARRGHSGASTVDGHPWMWKNFTRHGYVTGHAEDHVGSGTFQYRMLGFKDPPTDHYMRPFYVAADPLFKNHRDYCLGSVPRHANFMNWFRHLFRMYREFPKVFFGFHCEFSHGDFNKLQAADDDLLKLLQDLRQEGFLNNTLLILMADHGARFNKIRGILQGKLEERNPYFGVYLPPAVLQRYPGIQRNLRINSQRLTTPFDVHATFMDVLSFRRGGEGPVRREIKIQSSATSQSKKIKMRRGISLFQEIPAERTCSDADVKPHWCACLDWQPVSQSDERAVAAIKASLDIFNSITKERRDMCPELRVREVTRALRYVPTEADIEAEKRDMDFQNSEPMKTGLLKDEFLPALLASKRELYQVSFITEPGQGHFEVTSTYDVSKGTFTLNPRDISRINKYGSAPDCLKNKYPQMNPFCYCKGK